jgi:glycosyltransferase involved in cell wall biosynthesis
VNIWILQTGEPLHIDEDKSRPMRAMNLANALVDAGHNVTLWSAAFNHQKKSHRTRVFETRNISKNLCIKLIPSMGYEANISIKRLLDHCELALRLKSILNLDDLDPPDVAFIGYPPIEVAFVMTRWLRIHGVPVMIDVKDLWPTNFIEPLPIFLQTAGQIALAPYEYLGKKTIAMSSAFCSMSPSYVDWMEEFSGKERGQYDVVAPLTSPIIENDPISEESAQAWWKDQGVNLKNKNKIIFVGSQSRAFNFIPIQEAAEYINNKGIDLEFIICGSGPENKKLKNLFEASNNVKLPGWIDTHKFASLAKSSIATIAPYVSSKNFKLNVPNKIIDSLALGLPIITTLEGEVKKIIDEKKIGFSYSSCIELCSIMENFSNGAVDLKTIEFNCKTLYESNFASSKVYHDLVKSLERLSRS